MMKQSETVQNRPKPNKKRRSREEKLGRRKLIIRKLRQQDRLLKRIDRRTRMLAAGLRELLLLGEDYVSMVACHDEIDVALLYALREAGAAGRQSGELAELLGINYRYVSRRVRRMNRRMEQEIGEAVIEKHGHKWMMIPRLRRDFVASAAEEE